jgi:hypothetical protein
MKGNVQFPPKNSNSMGRTFDGGYSPSARNICKNIMDITKQGGKSTIEKEPASC